MGSGTPASTTVFRTEFVDGTTYHWRVRAQDSHGATSAWSTTCQFTVDRTAPGTDITVSSAQYPDYDQGGLVSTVPAGTPGQFTIDAKGDPDIFGFYLAIENDAPTRYVPANAPGGTATVTLTPTRTGPGTVYVRTFDGVNPSAGTATYTFFALAPFGPHAHRGDLNADGHTDLIGLTADGDLCLHLGDGTGGFLAGLGCDIQIDHNRTGWRQLVRAGDWDGDGWNDLLAVNMNGNLVYHYGTGAGSFSSEATEVLVGWDDDGNPIATTGWDRYDVIVGPGDWDGDGAPDLITRDADGELWLHRGNGYGGWADESSPVRIGTADTWQRFDTILAPGDMEGDGYVDLLARTTAGDLVLFPGDGSGGFLDPAGIVIGTGWDAYGAGLFASGDFNGDGRSDVFGIKSNGDLYVCYGDPNAPGYFVNGADGTKIGTGWNIFTRVR